MIRYALIAAVAVVSGAAVHYIVPQTDVVRAVGVETKRVDLESGTTTEGGQTTRDVYFVQTEDVDDASPMVYRNEDNLLYAKWNSADIQARAQSLASDKQMVAVSHYGWRVRLFSAFPNVLSVKPVDAAYTPIPYLFLIVLGLVWGGLFMAYRKVSSFGRSVSERRENRRAERASRRSGSSSDTSDLSDFLGGSDD